MGCLLTLDRGNSALKVDVWDDDNLIETVVMPPACIRRQLRALASRHVIDDAIYCSVTDDGSAVSEVLAEAGVMLRILSHDTPLPIEIGYASRQTLGVDRIAGSIGAWSLHKGKELLVVDLGTAITYDRVNAEGVFMGGNIAPGMSLRLKSLNAFTARLPKVELDGSLPIWGYDTDTALRSGAIRGIAAEVAFYHSILPDGAVTVITGGSANRIARLLEFEVDHQPHLVTLGLRQLLKFFQKQQIILNDITI